MNVNFSVADMQTKMEPKVSISSTPRGDKSKNNPMNVAAAPVLTNRTRCNSQSGTSNINDSTINNIESATALLSDTDASSSVEYVSSKGGVLGGRGRLYSDAGTGSTVGGGGIGGCYGVSSSATIGSTPLRGGGGGGYSACGGGTRTTSDDDINGNDGDRDDDDTDEDTMNQELTDPSLAFNFMMEHRIFLRAALDLLTERDRHAPELGMMDPIVLKSGPLKKASHLMNGVWKVKYVEIRRGMFSYYENAITQSKDAQGEAELLRKNIPLEASSVACRAVKLHQKALALSPTGAIFELSFDGGSTKRLWMANSREERYVWIQSINNAMVGASVTRGFDASLIDHSGYVRNVNGKSPFKTDLRMYLKSQNTIKSARTKHDYLLAMKDLVNKSLQIPVKWIEKQGGENGGTNDFDKKAFREETVAMSIEQVWRDLQRDSVRVDEELYKGDSLHGPERIFGALTNRILKVAGRASGKASGSDLRESQALVYARDILIAGNRTRSAGDSYYCVNTLCSNSDLVVVVPAGTTVSPISFQVSEDNSIESFQSRFMDKCGWFKTRNSLQLRWTKLFFVLSEGTLSYYAGALPRPHGLRGQRYMKVSTISITRKAQSRDNNNNNNSNNNNNNNNTNKKEVQDNSTGGIGMNITTTPNQNNTTATASNNNTTKDQFILKIASEDATTKDRLLLFESEDRLLDWVYALECVTKSNNTTTSMNHANIHAATTTTTSTNNSNKDTIIKHRRRMSGKGDSKDKDNNTTMTATASINLEDATQTSTSNTTITTVTNANPTIQNTNNNNTTTTTTTVNNSTMVEILSSAEQATKDHATKLGIDSDVLESKLHSYSRRATSAVCISVSASTDYKVCTLDPEGDDSIDTWANLTAHFLQAFRVTGGPNGRIMRGEETVRVVVTNCAETETTATMIHPQQPQQQQPQHGDFTHNNNSNNNNNSTENPTTGPIATTTATNHTSNVSTGGGTTPLLVAGSTTAIVPPSPATMRGRMNRRIFRNFGAGEDSEFNATTTTGSPEGPSSAIATPAAAVTTTTTMTTKNTSDGNYAPPE